MKVYGLFCTACCNDLIEIFATRPRAEALKQRLVEEGTTALLTHQGGGYFHPSETQTEEEITRGFYESRYCIEELEVK